MKVLSYTLLFIIICGLTLIRDRDWTNSELEYYIQINYGLWSILISFLILILPIFRKFKVHQDNNHIIENDITQEYQQIQQNEQQQLSQTNNIQQVQQTDLSQISNKNEQSELEKSNLTIPSKIIQPYANSYQLQESQIYEEPFSLTQILEIIDLVPILVVKKYDEFIRNNREQRRKLLNLQEFNIFTAQEYIVLLKNLFRFHDTLISKGQKYCIYKKKLDYKQFMKSKQVHLLDSLSSNEILSHQRFALQQLKYSLSSNRVLLQYQILEVYQILIDLMKKPNKILQILNECLINDSLYTTSVIQYYLEDYTYQMQGIEDEDFQKYLKIYHNNSQIINMQYMLDELIHQFYK